MRNIVTEQARQNQSPDQISNLSCRYHQLRRVEVHIESPFKREQIQSLDIILPTFEMPRLEFPQSKYRLTHGPDKIFHG
jgi:hypothetical protein